MASFNFVKNLRESIQPANVLSDASGALAAIPYVLVPTMVGSKDWTGLALAFGTTWAIGAAFNNQAIKGGAFAMAATHLMMSYLKEDIEIATGKELWNFTVRRGVDGLYGLSSDVQSEYYTLPSGEPVRSYRPSDLPATTYGEGGGYESMMDFYEGPMRTGNAPAPAPLPSGGALSEFYESQGMADVYSQPPGMIPFALN